MLTVASRLAVLKASSFFARISPRDAASALPEAARRHVTSASALMRHKRRPQRCKVDLQRSGCPKYFRFGSTCEELRVSKSSPLCADKQTSTRGAATWLMG